MLTPNSVSAYWRGLPRGASRFGCLLTLLCTCGATGAADPSQGLPLHQVGLGDSRQGYESEAYRTDSRVVVTGLGERQALQALSRDVPLGLPRVHYQLRGDHIDLGRELFFDRRLSANDTLSCAMCHIPEQGFTQNELATPVGHQGRGVRRNVPSLYNVGYVSALFLDGRESSLEAQIWSPLLAANEMANADRNAVINKLRANTYYRDRFAAVFEEGLTESTLGAALAAYQRAILSGDSPFDRWYFGGSDSQTDLPEAALTGFDVFIDKGCASCHRIAKTGALFTDGEYHNTGVGYVRHLRALRPERVQLAPGVFVAPRVDAETETFIDDGRREVTGDPQDQWRYRTPSLRNVSLTAPYMHDGSLPTLESVVSFYAQGGGGDPLQDPRTRNIALSATEQAALVSFLRMLTSAQVDLLVADARSVRIGERIENRQ